jgi:hypothetical protein
VNEEIARDARELIPSRELCTSEAIASVAQSRALTNLSPNQRSVRPLCSVMGACELLEGKLATARVTSYLVSSFQETGHENPRLISSGQVK